MARKITEAQRKKIWAKRYELGMPEEHLRDIVRFVSGQESTKVLTRFQAKVVIDILEGKSFNPPPNQLQREITMRPRKNKKVIGRFLPLASPRQIAFIESLRIEAGYGDDDHFKNHLRKYRKVESLQELDAKMAGALIDFLKKRRKKPEGSV